MSRLLISDINTETNRATRCTRMDAGSAECSFELREVMSGVTKDPSPRNTDIQLLYNEQTQRLVAICTVRYLRDYLFDRFQHHLSLFKCTFNVGKRANRIISIVCRCIFASYLSTVLANNLVKMCIFSIRKGIDKISNL